jgi:predicted AlkP superfamily phosphohydrolase/phosphomutase
MSDHVDTKSLSGTPDTPEFSLEYVDNSLERTRSFLNESRERLKNGDYDGAYSWMKNAEQEMEKILRVSAKLTESGEIEDGNLARIFEYYVLASFSLDSEYIRTLLILWVRDLETNRANAKVTPKQVLDMISGTGTSMILGSEQSEKARFIVASLEKDYVLSKLDRDLKRLEEDPKSRASLEPAIRE